MKLLETAKNCDISALNNKAIQLVQQGEGRNAVKLFLQALSSLKSEVCSGNHHSDKCVSSDSASAFVRIALPGGSHSHSHTNTMTTYETLFGLNPNMDPCAPQQRDGSTACLLFNMALSHQRCTDCIHQPKVRAAHLKKAAMTYNMAFSAAQHWKKWTDRHSGYQILCLAIVNNLLVIHNELGNTDKVTQLHGLLRDTLFGTHNKGDDAIETEEFSLFAKNLQRCTGDGPQVLQVASPSGSVSTPTTTGTCTAGASAAAATSQPTIIGANSA